MAVYFYKETLPVFTDIPSPFCVSCSKRECHRGFVDFAGEVTFMDTEKNYLVSSDIFICGTCLERTVVSQLGGISKEDRDRREGEVATKEELCLKAAQEVEALRLRLEGVQNLVQGVLA